MRKISKHIIHCSDSILGDVNSLRRYHKSKGWRDIGYHFVIKQDGVIELGRPIEKMGAHCRKHNKHSIGTCLIGRNVFTDCQFASLKKIHQSLNALFPDIELIEHNKLNPNKTCPNFKIEDGLKRVK